MKLFLVSALAALAVFTRSALSAPAFAANKFSDSIIARREYKTNDMWEYDYGTCEVETQLCSMRQGRLDKPVTGELGGACTADGNLCWIMLDPGEGGVGGGAAPPPEGFDWLPKTDPPEQ